MALRWALVVVVAVGAGAAFGAGCGSSSSDNPGSTGDDGGLADGNMDDAFVLPGDSGTAGPIEIRPMAPVLAATGMPITQPFQAFVQGTQTPVTASWIADNNPIGLIDVGTGTFTAKGTVGGVSNVIAKTPDNRSATTTITINVKIADNPGNVGGGDQTKLKAGGPLSNDTGFKWLYPYDLTVFPRGLRAPTMQFGGNAPDAVYVHVESKYLAYDAFYGASSPARVTLDEARWKSITESAGGHDTVTVSVTKMTGGVVTGPIKQTWTIAEGSLKGSVYYNTYSTPQAMGTGALLKVRPGTTIDAQVFRGGCTVCHSVSANGNVIVSGVDWATGNPKTSGVFNIDTMGNITPGYSEALGRFSFGGLTPDGKYMMSHAVQPGGVRGLSGSYGSSLFDTANGMQKAATGWDGVVQNAQMPSFSPDGKFIVFNNRDRSAGHTLSVAGFNQATLSFSAPVDVWTDNANLLAWPAFLPDSAAVVFHTGNDFGTQHSTGDIEIVDVAQQKRFKLPALNGFTGTDSAFTSPFLPYGEAAEAHMNFEPTVLPVAVGGYYWVIFTSRRCYGNFFTPATDPWAQSSTQTELSPRKKLWVAAIDLNAAPGQDRSHPPFYLPGQELDTGNMRAFWALDACHQNGDSCESGDECCNGFCRQVTNADGGTSLSCTSAPTGCANEFEKCTTSGDCCGATQGYKCVNGHCARPAPP